MTDKVDVGWLAGNAMRPQGESGYDWQQLADAVNALLGEAKAESADLFKRLSNQEKANSESRRSLCAQRDKLQNEQDQYWAPLVSITELERDEARNRIDAALDVCKQWDDPPNPTVRAIRRALVGEQ